MMCWREVCESGAFRPVDRAGGGDDSRDLEGMLRE